MCIYGTNNFTTEQPLLDTQVEKPDTEKVDDSHDETSDVSKDDNDVTCEEDKTMDEEGDLEKKAEEKVVDPLSSVDQEQDERTEGY